MLATHSLWICQAVNEIDTLNWEWNLIEAFGDEEVSVREIFEDFYPHGTRIFDSNGKGFIHCNTKQRWCERIKVNSLFLRGF